MSSADRFVRIVPTGDFKTPNTNTVTDSRRLAVLWCQSTTLSEFSYGSCSEGGESKGGAVAIFLYFFVNR